MIVLKVNRVRQKMWVLFLRLWTTFVCKHGFDVFIFKSGSGPLLLEGANPAKLNHGGSIICLSNAQMAPRKSSPLLGEALAHSWTRRRAILLKFLSDETDSKTEKLWPIVCPLVKVNSHPVMRDKLSSGGCFLDLCCPLRQPLCFREAR